MLSVFISYSHADEELRQKLDLHLTSLKRQNIIDVWHDRRITAGEEIAVVIDAALTRADIVLLLISPDFIASSYCFDVEMTEALRRHERGEAVVIPVILRACDWHGLSFGHLRATPTDGKPIRLFPDLDSGFLDVVRDVKAAAQRLTATRPSATPAPSSIAISSAEPVTRDEPRSGNLGIKKSFSDFDRDRFREESFEYIARYFENSLGELARRNPEIRTGFRCLDPTAFEAAVYDAFGKIKSRCGVWLLTSRSLGGEISYSATGIGDRGAYNESLSVAEDGTSLGLQPLGMLSPIGGSIEKRLLTQEGGAEYLWSAFLGPIQK